ncbi:MAG: glycosyltransferase, partial [Bradyrhizobium sp.]
MNNVKAASVASAQCEPRSKDNASRRDVAIFLRDLGGGGAERVAVLLAAGLEDLGLAVDLVLMRREGPHLASVSPRVRIVELGGRRALFSFVPLASYLRRVRPRAVLAVLTHANVAAVLAGKLAATDARIVLSEHSMLSRQAAARRSWWRKPISHRLVPWLYRRADAIVAVSNGTADDLAAFGGLPREDIQVIYNPVIDPSFEDRAREPPDHSWFAPGAPPVILAAGRLDPPKDFATLIRAFALLRRERPARLMILGEGSQR